MKPTPFRSLAAATLFLTCAWSALLLPLDANAQRRTRTPPTPRRTPDTQRQTDAQEGQPAARQVTAAPSMLIRWQGTPGVERYRLQVARDDKFGDIVFDRAVVGREYRIEGLAPGTYFWHVAPAAGETGKYSNAAPVEITAGAVTPASASTPTPSTPTPIPTGTNVVVASNATGWRTATGEVTRLASRVLRPGREVPDIVGVNRDGAIYALDGATGVALWTTRFRPNAKRGEETGSSSPVTFAPLAIPASDGASNVVVAFEGGVRALRGETGREAWRTQLAAGVATGGVTADMDADNNAEVYVVAGSPSTLYVLEAATGKITSETKLEATVVGSPSLYAVGDAKGVILSLDNSAIEVRNMKGESLRSVKLHAQITTPPLIVTTSHGMILTVGTEKGLDALDAAELKPLGRISTESDTVHGTLAAADLDSDGTPEIVLVTRQGRVAVVGTTDGKIKWYAEGAPDAGVANFADLNGDGILDVLVPAGAVFALGFSGRDGSLIWRTEDDARAAIPAPTANSMRALTIAPTSGGAGFIVGGEPSRIGLRAVELPRGAFKTAAK